MSSWKIDGAQVKVVLDNVTTYADQFQEGLSEDEFTDLENCLTGGATEGSAGVNSVMGSVPTAVDNLIASLGDDLTSIGNYIQAGAWGVASATVAYNQGNEEMAATFQSEMITAAQTGDFTFFKENNVLGE
ncbi:Hypothetical protein PROPJV5_1071 [Propionibacterium ruminifibrarum]|uniref:Excreted virulence factor EspC, type VII ESX diderm n=1 Tax=Propionibacterium ruminifibrarum TaxID=1962131 RepID=A0A375I4H8_9ACTN|nr:DUF6507 family protein [Propionibacterium ruminifibrarum]SPF68128.1 Hypothetical protein PROPJV5_1071 [Propionibacterium ruminifibrarum]